MSLRIALHPDHIPQPDGTIQSYSDRWLEIAPAAGAEIRLVDAYAPDLISQIRGCDAFMWRLAFQPPDTVAARRILWSVAAGLGIPVFPAFESIWFFEDKVAQAYLLDALDVPRAQTSIFWTRADALAAIDQLRFPVVAKLATGVKSNSVAALHSADEARRFVHRMFGLGATDLQPRRGLVRRLLGHRATTAGALLRGRMPATEHGYVLFQEFVPDNPGDTKLMLIGNRVLAVSRRNRPGDFRASGSGLIDWDPTAIDPAAVRLCFRVADALSADVLALDMLQRAGEPVIVEMSFSASLAIFSACPGHWRREGDRLEWVDGKINPADAIFHDFLARVSARA